MGGSFPGRKAQTSHFCNGCYPLASAQCRSNAGFNSAFLHAPSPTSPRRMASVQFGIMPMRCGAPWESLFWHQGAWRSDPLFAENATATPNPSRIRENYQPPNRSVACPSYTPNTPHPDRPCSVWLNGMLEPSTGTGGARIASFDPKPEMESLP